MNNLVFQGSFDNINWTDLFRTDDSVIEGWNYFNWDEQNKPGFTLYRFYGNQTKSCEIGEIQFTGVKTITNNDPTYTCDTKVVVDNVETLLPT